MRLALTPEELDGLDERLPETLRVARDVRDGDFVQGAPHDRHATVPECPPLPFVPSPHSSEAVHTRGQSWWTEPRTP